jgi:hypothetical protein
MRSGGVSALAAAACILICCDLQPTLPGDPPTQPAQPETVPKQVQELIEMHCLTDQSISENAEQDPTGGLWPPVPVPACSVYAVTFLWGHLLDVRMPPFPVVDWSGELSVSSGVAKVLRTIDFEEGEDYLLPVDDSAVAAWVSKTSGDFDGLGVLIRIPATSTADAGYLDLTFQTVPFSIKLPFSRLERLIAFYPVGDTEGVAVLARRVDGFACPRGFIKGEWVPDADDGSRGSLRGMWYDLFGIPVGTMAGSFWTNPDGTRQFEGWLSGVYLTVVLAEFQGTWSGGEGHGQFEGAYRYLHSKETGVLWGEFGDDTRLSLVGIWRADCLIATAESSAAGP